MEFKFRAHGRPTNHISPLPATMNFSEQALRASFSANLRPISELIGWPNYAQEALQELEKEQIKKEIIEGEITRRRILEAEVMRELMMEREMAMLRASGAEGLSVNEHLGMRFEPRVPLARSFEERMEGLTSPGCNAVDAIRFRWFQEARAIEIKPKLEVNKDKLILLAKPYPNLCGLKRKAERPPAVSGSLLQSSGLKNKPNEELSCALCQVSATSEKGLNEHLQGKKHKAKEASVMANKMSKTFNTVPLLKKIKPYKPIQTTGSASSVLEVKTKGASHQNKETEDCLHQEMRTREYLNNNSSCTQPLLQKLVENPKKKNKARMEKSGEFKKTHRFKFWCEMCQIGAYTQNVMDDHEKGKKHMARLQEIVKNRGTVDNVLTFSMMVSEAIKEAVDADVDTKEMDKKSIECVRPDKDESGSFRGRTN